MQEIEVTGRGEGGRQPGDEFKEFSIPIEGSREQKAGGRAQAGPARAPARGLVARSANVVGPRQAKSL